MIFFVSLFCEVSSLLPLILIPSVLPPPPQEAWSLPLVRSISQEIVLPINQSINQQTINQSFMMSDNQSINQSFIMSGNQSII